MSAFGQAGFGSRNRRNQLRSQGQMDPYGQQVRAAKQAPTFNVYQTQGTQQAAGQQQPPSPSQPAQQPAAAQPSLQLGAPAMPAYSQPAAPIAGSAQGGPGTAQPIQPQSQGTPYGADPGYADRVAAAEQQWSSTPAGSQKRDWEGNTARNMLARGLPPDMAARDASGMSMDVVRASQDLEQRLRQNDDYMRQLRATDGVVLGPNQRWMQPSLQPNAPQQVYEVAGFGVGPDGKTMQPIYQPAKGKLQLRSQAASRKPVAGPSAAEPVQFSMHPDAAAARAQFELEASVRAQRGEEWWDRNVTTQRAEMTKNNAAKIEALRTLMPATSQALLAASPPRA